MTTAEKLTTIAENQQKVYDAGKSAEWNAFWDAYQQNGERTAYGQGFWTAGWSDVNFKPKYDVRPATLNYAFQNSLITDLKGILERQGVILDTANCANMAYCFNASNVTRLPVLDLRSISANGLQYAFYQARDLTSIDEIILKDDGSQNFSYTFVTCPKLTDITVKGCIGQAISFSGNDKLSHDSLMSIINALMDLTESGTTKKLTIGSTNLGKLTAAEKAVATDKGWTLA